jgi:glucan 1,3-beta-glucosidase
VDPYVPGAWPYFLRALNWARAHGVHVIVDIHGAPGSQNGFDNSGQRTGDIRWADEGSNNVARTLDVLRYVMANAGGLIDIIELLNEPGGFRSEAFAAAVRQYFLDGYNVVREAAGGAPKVMISDAFLTVAVSNLPAKDSPCRADNTSRRTGRTF